MTLNVCYYLLQGDKIMKGSRDPHERSFSLDSMTLTNYNLSLSPSDSSKSYTIGLHDKATTVVFVNLKFSRPLQNPAKPQLLALPMVCGALVCVFAGLSGSIIVQSLLKTLAIFVLLAVYLMLVFEHNQLEDGVGNGIHPLVSVYSKYCKF